MAQTEKQTEVTRRQKQRIYEQHYREKNREKLNFRAQRFREENREKVNDCCKRYREENPEKVKATLQRYREKNREKRKCSDSRYAKENKVKVNAKVLAQYYRKKGTIRQIPCVVCGKVNSEAHHPDYLKPLSVIWLCHLHHARLHHGLIKLKEI